MSLYIVAGFFHLSVSKGQCNVYFITWPVENAMGWLLF